MKNTDKEEELIEAAESKAITLNYIEDLDINTVVDTVCDMLVEFAKSDSVKQYHLPQIKNEDELRWQLRRDYNFLLPVINMDTLFNWFLRNVQLNESDAIEFHNWVNDMMYLVLNSKMDKVYVNKNIYNRDVINGHINKNVFSDENGVTIEELYKEFLKQ